MNTKKTFSPHNILISGARTHLYPPIGSLQITAPLLPNVALCCFPDTMYKTFHHHRCLLLATGILPCAVYTMLLRFFCYLRKYAKWMNRRAVKNVDESPMTSKLITWLLDCVTIQNFAQGFAVATNQLNSRMRFSRTGTR